MIRKKIALISDHASPLAKAGRNTDSGGQNVYVAQVARYLCQSGFEVDVFTRRDDRRLPEVVHWVDDVRIIHIDAGPACAVPKEDLLPYMEEFYRNMSRWVKTGQYGLIHANFWLSGLVALRLKRQLDVPFVITFHALGIIRKMFQGVHDRFPAERIDIEREVAAEADAVIAECPQDALILLQLGRLVPRKGIDTAIRAFGHFKKKYGVESAYLYIAGGDNSGQDPGVDREMKRLQHIVKEEELDGQVVFTGFQPRSMLKFYYSAADVFITTPWYEPFGMTPLEAMACGTAVIGARVGGIKFSVIHGHTGWLVPPRNVQAVSEYIGLFYDYPWMISDFGARGLKHVRRFSWQNVVNRMTSVYDQIISKPSMPLKQELSLQF